MASMRAWFLIVPSLVICACGSESSSSSPPTQDGGAADGGTTTNADGGAPVISAQCSTSVKAGDSCTDESGCCEVRIPDGFGPEGYRCKNLAWTRDDTCLPPPPACPAPLTGTLTRSDASTVNVTCSTAGGLNGVASVVLTLSSGELMEIYFDRAPTAGDVLDVIPFDEGPREDGGSANRVGFRVGRPGGFSGFDVRAESKSGKLTVTAVDATPPTKIRSVSGTLDAEVTGNPPWPGKLTGSW